MGKGIRKPAGTRERESVSLSELIHQHVRVAIETAVHEELQAALGTSSYERSELRRGYRNGIRERTLTGPTGPVALALPRATLFRGAGGKEWDAVRRSEEHTSELQSRLHLVCRLLLEKKNKQ